MQCFSMQLAHPSMRRRVILARHGGIPMAVVVTRPEDSSCLAYNSNKEEIYAFDTITGRFRSVRSSCNSWSAPSAATVPRRAASPTSTSTSSIGRRETTVTCMCTGAKRFARALSITRLSGPRQVVTKLLVELPERLIESLRASVAARK